MFVQTALSGTVFVSIQLYSKMIYRTEDADWQEMTAKLKAYRGEHGHANAPISGHLGAWIAKQRIFLRLGKLPPEHRHTLETAGVVLAPNSKQILDERWMQALDEFKEFVAEHGGQYPIQQSQDQDEKRLSRWVGSQRSSRETMSESRRQLLDALSFIWDSHQAEWLSQFDAFVAYMQLSNGEHPSTHSKDPKVAKLGRWVGTQRTYQDTMPAERRLLLDQAGLVWDLHTKWLATLGELQNFIEAHDGRYPARRSNDAKELFLGCWVNTQRQGKSMTDERRDILDEVGFAWKAVSEFSKEQEFSPRSAPSRGRQTP